MAWIGVNSGKGFMIAPETIRHKGGDVIVGTVHEWGAWRSYLKGLQLFRDVRAMDDRRYYMVPTQWPHHFDLHRPAADDYEAGNGFARIFGDQRAKERNLGGRVDRAASVIAAKRRFPWEPRKEKTPEKHLKAPAKTFNDPEALADFVESLPDRG